MSFALHHEMICFESVLKNPIDVVMWPQRVEEMMMSLLNSLGMEALGPLKLYHTTRDDNTVIRSFIQPITTSHIAGHYYVSPENNEPHLYFDVYTCDGISIEKTLEVVDRYMHIEKWKGMYVKRDIEDTRYVVSLRGSNATDIQKDLLHETPQELANIA